MIYIQIVYQTFDLPEILHPMLKIGSNSFPPGGALGTLNFIDHILECTGSLRYLKKIDLLENVLECTGISFSILSGHPEFGSKTHLVRAQGEIHPRERQGHLVVRTPYTLIFHVIFLITFAKTGANHILAAPGMRLQSSQDYRLVICTETFKILLSFPFSPFLFFSLSFSR